jgi:hypothetical protein
MCALCVSGGNALEEFIFGTFATDQLKLMHHRANLAGVQHQHDLVPRDPLPGQPITVQARTGATLNVDQVACYYTTDGTQPRGAHGTPRNGAVIILRQSHAEWDTLAWGYSLVWAGELPPQSEGTLVRYQIGAWAGEGPECFADWPQVKAASEIAAAAYFRGEAVPDVMVGDPHKPFTFSASVDRFAPPQWARQAVIYHIFVDRFFPGQGRDWLQTTDLDGIVGGTLRGVAEKLDYIQALGANCLWLSPVFVSPTHHGYDVVDYAHVDPRYGGDEALHDVVNKAHQRGLRVILDVAFNHLSNEHPFFVEAQANPDSPYRDWFTFDESEIGYRSFFGVVSMPQLNVANPACRQWLIDTACYWLTEFDVDGFRLDVADGPGPSFWAEFRAACRRAKPESFSFGEVVDAPDVQQQYIGKLDGLLDFHLCEALRKTYATGSWSAADFDRFYQRHASSFPDDFLMLSFVDNHDMDRFLLMAGEDKAALRRAAARQFQLDRIPVIYYGTEIGLHQPQSVRAAGMGLHLSRVPMVWGASQDAELLAFYQKLIRTRQSWG